MNFYEINAELRSALDKVTVDDETGEVTGVEDVERLNIEFDDKAEGLAVYIKELDALGQDIKEEADKLLERKRRVDKRAECMRQILTDAMVAAGRCRIATPRAEVSFRRSSSVSVTDASIIPQDFKSQRVTELPNKTAISKAIKSGVNVPGAEIVESLNIQIK